MEINAFNAWFNSIRAQSFSAYHWLKASALSAVESTKKLFYNERCKNVSCLLCKKFWRKIQSGLEAIEVFLEVTIYVLHTVAFLKLENVGFQMVSITGPGNFFLDFSGY